MRLPLATAAAMAAGVLVSAATVRAADMSKPNVVFILADDLGEFFEDGHLELYNLVENIGEQHDLAGKMPQRTRQMHEMLLAWRTRVDAKMPRPNPSSAKRQGKEALLRRELERHLHLK